MRRTRGRTRPVLRRLAVPLRAANAAATAYVAGLTVAAWVGHVRSRDRTAPLPEPRHRFAFVVPAHDEEHLIAATVASLLHVDHPGGMVSVHVVADHCTDATAERARTAGAVVHERRDGAPGKSAALAWVAPRVVAAADPDAVVFVDADTVLHPGFLTAVDARLAAGARVVQGRYEVAAPDTSPVVALRAASFATRAHLRALGREALGLSAGLFGNGMVVHRDLLAELPWVDDLTEDVRLHLELVAAGERVTYAADAIATAEMPTSLAASRGQNARWEGGRLGVARELPAWLGRIRSAPAGTRLRLAEAVTDAVVPPVSVLVGVAAPAALAAALGRLRRRRPHPLRTGWTAAVAVQAAAVASALVLVRAPWSVWRSLLGAPRLLAWKVALYAQTATGRERAVWQRTARNAERHPDGDVTLLQGLPLARLTSAETLDAIDAMVAEHRRSGRHHQIATVNTDHVVNAARDPDLRRLLQGLDLLTADGMPVVWASRWHRRPVPERVTGSDLLVPLAERCAMRGYRLALVGGAPGIAERAATLLAERAPGLVVRGLDCPVLARAEDVDDATLDEIAAFGPDVLLVALGHPKQEWFAHLHGPHVGAAVSMGVGASLDFLVGESRRAPRSLQRLGLEWAHRVAGEPRRLGRRYLRDALHVHLLLNTAVEPRSSAAGRARPVRRNPNAGTVPLRRADDRAQDRLGRRLVVDVGAVGGLTHDLLGGLVGEAARRRAAGGAVVLVGLSEGERRYLRRLRLHDCFVIAPDRRRPEGTP